MRYSLAFGLAATALAGHVSIPFSRERFSHQLSHVKRQETDPLSLEAFNNITGGGYYSEFEVGTPPQKISFLLDTGSSDTWVNSVDADLCKSKKLQKAMGFCQSQFNQKESSTFKVVQKGGFNITYLDSRNIQGDYVKDIVHIGDISIKGQQLGLAHKSVRPTGIMGLGFSSNVAAEHHYATIVDNLVSQGFIDSAAFSLYMNDLSTDSGNILFGGIDSQKFVGDLAVLPLVSDYQGGLSLSNSGETTSYNVKLEGFDIKSPSGDKKVDITQLNAYAILDSGSTISLLPEDQVKSIWDEFGVLAFSDVLAPFIDCAYAGELGRGYVFEFRFDGKTIQVPMDEMVIDAYADIQDQIFNDPSLKAIFNDWKGACMFGIGSAADFGINSKKFTLLGATFLRSAYVVYDLANNQLAIAQANLNSTQENVVEITAGKLPVVIGVDSQSDSNPSLSTTSTTSSRRSRPTGTDIVTGPTTTDITNEESASVRMSPPLVSVATLFGLAAFLTL